MTPRVSILVPAHNEASTVAEVVRRSLALDLDAAVVCLVRLRLER